MEFPAYNFVIASVYKIVHHDWLAVGRILSMLCAFGVILLLNSSCINTPLASAVLRLPLLLAISFTTPFFSKFSTTIMPETMAMLCAISSIVLFFRYRFNKSIVILVASALLLCLAALIRPYYIFFGLPYLSEFLLNAKSDQRQSLLMLLAGIITLTPFFVWYHIWVPHLNQTYHTGYFYMGTPLLQSLRSLPHSVAINLAIVLRDYFGYTYLPIFGLGIYRYFKQPNHQPRWQCIHFHWLVIAASAFVVLPFIIADHADPHYYFLGAVFPAAVVFSVYGVLQLNDICNDSIFGRVFLTFLFAAMLVITFHNLHKGYQTERELNLLLTQRDQLLKQIPSNALVITEGANPAQLYMLQRKGWWLDDDLLFEGKSIEQLHQMGGDFLLSPPKWQDNKLVYGYILTKL